MVQLQDQSIISDILLKGPLPWICSTKLFHCLPFWYIFGSVALFGNVVVDESKLTSLSPGGDAVEADLELGAVLRVGVLGVGVQDASLQGLVGTLEPVDSHLVL